MNRKKYLQGLEWGQKVSSKIGYDYKNLKSVEKTCLTCERYIKNKRKKNGKYITKSDRDFYRGACDGINYNKIRYYN